MNRCRPTAPGGSIDRPPPSTRTSPPIPSSPRAPRAPRASAARAASPKRWLWFEPTPGPRRVEAARRAWRAGHSAPRATAPRGRGRRTSRPASTRLERLRSPSPSPSTHAGSATARRPPIDASRLSRSIRGGPSPGWSRAPRGWSTRRLRLLLVDCPRGSRRPPPATWRRRGARCGTAARRSHPRRRRRRH